MKAVAAALALAVLPTAALAAPPRVASLDQCADQYVLALSPPASIAGVSPRADDPDSRLRARARDIAKLRPTLEAVLMARPEVVVRYWGGDPRLMARLEDRGVQVVQIDDATDFAGIRANVRQVAAALEQVAAGERLVAQMDARLAAAAGAAAAPRGEALYLTAGGFTAGPGTLIDAILGAAGFANAAEPGFAPVSVERIALTPPVRFVLGFFELMRADWRGPGRHPVVQRAAARVPTARLPGELLGCPAWFAGEAVSQLAQAGR